LVDNRRDGLHLTDSDNKRILVFSTGSNTVVEEIPVGYLPWSMVVSADGSRLYVTHPNDKLISIVDVTVTPPSVTPVPVAQIPFAGFLPPRGDRLYMTHWISQVAGLFRVIDLTTMLAGSINIHLSPVGLLGDDTRAYVGSGPNSCIDVLDTTTIPPQLVESISVDGSPGYLVFSTDRKTLYANNFTGNNVIAVTLPA
jgi:DNA-binding beta-propeller fold protein YncE